MSQPIRLVATAPSMFKQNAMILEVDCPHCGKVVRLIIDVQETKFSVGVGSGKSADRTNLASTNLLHRIPPLEPRHA